MPLVDGRRHYWWQSGHDWIVRVNDSGRIELLWSDVQSSVRGQPVWLNVLVLGELVWFLGLIFWWTLLVTARSGLNRLSEWFKWNYFDPMCNHQFKDNLLGWLVPIEDHILMSNIWTLVHYLLLQGFILLICKIDVPVCSKYTALGCLVTRPVGKINHSTKSLWASSHSSGPVEWGKTSVAVLTSLAWKHQRENYKL